MHMRSLDHGNQGRTPSLHAMLRKRPGVFWVVCRSRVHTAQHSTASRACAHTYYLRCRSWSCSRLIATSTKCWLSSRSMRRRQCHARPGHYHRQITLAGAACLFVCLCAASGRCGSALGSALCIAACCIVTCFVLMHPCTSPARTASVGVALLHRHGTALS